MATDPLGVARERNMQSISGNRFTVGTIDDAFAYAGVYLVRTGGAPPYQAVDIRLTSCSPLGARSLSSYLPKTRVLLYFDPMIDKCPIIIGALPRSSASVNLLLPTSIVPRSGAGFVYDPVHHNILTDPRTAFGDYSGGRASDTIPGDWGAFNDMGVGFVAGRLMALMKASDGAQIQAFWGDDLIRVVGYNYELYNALTDDRRLNDEGECNGIEHEAAYAWESMGSREKGTSPVRTEEGLLEFGSEYTPYEPNEDDQVMWPRRVTLKGYLGDLRRMFLCAPNYDAYPINTMSSSVTYRGLAECLQSSDGTLVTRSAKALIFEKYSIIPVPKELKSPEDPTGDTRRTDSEFAGEKADVPDFEWGDEDNPGLRAAQMYDYIAWVMGKYSTDGLVKHGKDWYYPEESEVDAPVDRTTYDKSLDVLKTKFSLELPGFVELKVDHRKGRDKVKYYKSRSAVSMLDDGSVIIEDGYGSQIIMSGGNIRITCPGDVMLQPGRSMITMAPFDAVIRAGNSVDVSAANKDVRIKAECNCMIMGGNDSSSHGGVLIESRANTKLKDADLKEDGERTKMRGIVLKAPKSNMYSYSMNTYIGATEQVTMDVPNGIVYMAANEFNAKLLGVNILSSLPNSSELLSLTPSKTVISTALDIGGNVRIADAGGGENLMVGGSVIVHGGMRIGSGIENNGAYSSKSTEIAEMKRDADLGTKPQTVADEIEDAVGGAENRIQITEAVVRTNVDSPVKLESKIAFSYRDTELDLKLDEDSFVIFESRWQQLLRAGGTYGSGNKWTEPGVKSAISSEPSLPYPGRDGWVNWSAYGKIDLNNFNMAEGYANARTDTGQKSPGESPSKVSLEEGYKVIKKSGD
jgi:hypothetical protein